MAPFQVGLTPRDVDILDTLTHKVRILSAPQVARTWWPTNGEQSAVRRLLILRHAGLLISYSCFCHPELSLKEPVISWSLPDPEPDFGRASYQLKSRWCKPPTSLPCVSATTAAGRFFGGYGGRSSRESEQTHDVHLAAVYLKLRLTNQAEAHSWISEETIRRSRGRQKEKLPDAVICRNGQKHVVEFGGAYTKEKLSIFHAYCRDNDTSYEVW